MLDEATDRIRQDWQGQANSWYQQRDAFLSASRPVHDWLVDHLDPQDGQRVLDIAAGPGDTGFLVARRLGSGRLVSTDLAPAMVEVARQRGTELGIENADYRVLDAQAMDLSDASFDGAICRWGFMLMPNPAAALRECKRVLNPGGRLVFAVFTGPDENPFASLPAGVLMEAGHLTRPESPSEWQPGILALGDRTRLQSLLDEASFAATHVELVSMSWQFNSTEHFWDFLTNSTALGPLVRSLPGAARDSVRKKIDERLAAFTRDGTIALPARCWCGVAVR